MKSKIYLTVFIALMGVFQSNAQTYIFQTGFVKPESGSVPASGWKTAFTQISENIPGPGNHGQFEGAAAFKFIRGQSNKVGYLQSPKYPKVKSLSFWAFIELPATTATLKVEAIKCEEVTELGIITAAALSASEWKLFTYEIAQEDSIYILFTPTLPDDGDCRLWIDDLTIIAMDESTSTLDVDLMNVSFYPNPLQDKLFVSAKSDFQMVTIYNELGSIVERKEASGNYVEIDMSEKPTGFYLLQVEGRNGTSTHKIMKR